MSYAKNSNDSNMELLSIHSKSSDSLLSDSLLSDSLLSCGLPSTLNDKLLSEIKYTIKTKFIKKISMKGNQTVRIKKGNGLNMIVESYDPILCKIEGDTLYIEPYSVFKWSCCFPINMSDHHNISDYSESWTIDAIFIIKSIECKGYGVLLINDGFDKSLTCTNNGGSILITNLNVVNLSCKTSGNGKIKTIESSCYYFNGEASNDSYIKAPKVHSLFKCKINEKGKIEGSIYNKCKIDTNISKSGMLKLINLFESSY